MRRLALDYLNFDDKLELGLVDLDNSPRNQLSLMDAQVSPKESAGGDDNLKLESTIAKDTKLDSTIITEEKPDLRDVIGLGVSDSTAPLCYNCGNQTQRSGSCYVCTSCGSTTGFS